MGFLSAGRPGTLRCAVKVIPGASKTAVQGARGEELVVKVAAAPEKGKANQELVAYLSKACGLPKSSFRILSGKHSQHKLIELPEEGGTFLSGFSP